MGRHRHCVGRGTVFEHRDLRIRQAPLQQNHIQVFPAKESYELLNDVNPPCCLFVLMKHIQNSALGFKHNGETIVKPFDMLDVIVYSQWHEH